MIRDTSTLLTVREVAERLRISLATAYVLIKQGDLACCRIGGRKGAIRIRETDVASYLQECEVPIERAEDIISVPHVQLKHLRLN